MKNYVTLLFFLITPLFVFAQESIEKNNKSITKKENSRLKTKYKPLRQQRPFAIKLEAGFNSIAGGGLTTSIYPNKNLVFDVGGGYGIKGFRFGLQCRYLIKTKSFSPYLGLGVSRSMSQSNVINLNSSFTDENNVTTTETIIYSINNVNHLRPTLGIEFFSKNGFIFECSAGYAFTLNDPYNLIGGGGERVEKELNFTYGNGIILSFSLGYSFAFNIH